MNDEALVLKTKLNLVLTTDMTGAKDPEKTIAEKNHRQEEVVIAAHFVRDTMYTHNQQIDEAVEKIKTQLCLEIDFLLDDLRLNIKENGQATETG